MTCLVLSSGRMGSSLDKVTRCASTAAVLKVPPPPPVNDYSLSSSASTDLFSSLMLSITGMFRNGEPHGWCVQTLVSGDVYAGCLTRGRREGFGQYKWTSGDVYTGDPCDDVAV